jgi:hypothetical protein
MALNFTTTDKASTNHGIKALVFGGAGAGKTSLCGTAPSPIIISAEAGLLSLRNQSHPVLTVSTAAEMDEAFEWCKNDAVKNGIQTVCLDSISEIIEQILRDEKSKTKDPRAAYGEMANRGINIIKKFRDLPGLHVLVTAKQATVTDPITGVAKAAPTAPGQQVGQALPYLFDLVMHAATEKDPEGATYHYLRTHAAFNAEAKDRSGALDEIEFPDFSNIIQKMLAKPQPAQ